MHSQAELGNEKRRVLISYRYLHLHGLAGMLLHR